MRRARSGDFFCAGHTFDRDGGLIVVGGQNYKEKCLNPCDDEDHGSVDAVGHKLVYRLDTSVDPPVWSGAPWPVELGLERWYPSALNLPNGDVLVGGHTGSPSEACPHPYGAFPYTDPESGMPAVAAPIPEWRERLLLSGSPPVPLVAGPVLNRSALSCDPAEERVSLRDYPRLHLLSSRYILHTNGYERTDPVNPQRARFLGIDPSTAACLLADPANPFRWEDGDAPPIPSGQPGFDDRRGGSSVHMIARHSATPYDFTEVVYVIGGSDGENSDPCEDVEETTNSIIRLRGQPFSGILPTDTWDAALPPMTYERANHNSVILPDGSIFVVGGSSKAAVANCGTASESCASIRAPELFRPEEIFNQPGSWEVLPCQAHRRPYHSVAGVLADGSVVSAGGTAPGSVQQYHSLEVYYPWYWFYSTRPKITEWPDPVTEPITTIEETPEDLTFTVSVDVPCFPVQRVALLAPASATHAFDFNQRYVELALDAPAPNQRMGQIDVRKPEDNYVTPPGYYYLVIIDAQGAPSVGRWVRVSASQSS